MGLNTAQNQQAQGDAKRNVRSLRTPADDASLAADLGAGDRCTVEQIEGDGRLQELLAPFESAKLVVSVSTETAFRCALSNVLARALAERLPMEEGALADMEIATQEAIGNAVLHGNLGLPTLRAVDPSDLERRIAEIESRLKEPAFARRRVTVACDWTDSTLWIDVVDEGEGFEESALPTSDIAAGGGRGLGMIRRLADEADYDQPNRRMRMTFALGDRRGAR